MDLVARLSDSNDRTVLRVSGDIDLSTLPALHDHLARAVGSALGSTVFVDLDGVTSLDDAGMGVLLGWAGRLRESGGELVLVCTSERLLHRFAITGLSRAITVSGSLTA